MSPVGHTLTLLVIFYLQFWIYFFTEFYVKAHYTAKPTKTHNDIDQDQFMLMYCSIFQQHFKSFTNEILKFRYFFSKKFKIRIVIFQ